MSPADRRATPANLAARKRAHDLLDRLIDQTLGQEAFRFGRISLDLIVQQDTIADVHGGRLPYTQTPVIR